MAKVNRAELEQEYGDLLYQLGDTARTALTPAQGQKLRAYTRVVRAWDALEDRRLELSMIEQQMDDEERAFAEAQGAADEERAQLDAEMNRYRKVLAAVDEELKRIDRARGNRENALKYVYKAEREEERKIQEFEEAGKLDKAEASKRNLKKIKLEVMKGERELREHDEARAALLDPAEGTPGREGVLARARLDALEKDLAERQRELEELLAHLDDAAARKEQDVQGAQDFYDQAVALLGQEIFEQRIDHPALSRHYERLDQIGFELGG